MMPTRYIYVCIRLGGPYLGRTDVAGCPLSIPRRAPCCDARRLDCLAMAQRREEGGREERSCERRLCRFPARVSACQPSSELSSRLVPTSAVGCAQLSRGVMSRIYADKTSRAARAGCSASHQAPALLTKGRGRARQS